MPNPRAVVIPFAVPEGGRGLGLGLAALVHGFAQIDGASVALAQLHTRKKDGDGEPTPVEAFVPPHAWRDLAGAGNAPKDVHVIVTGAFEPPGEGQGALRLLAFNAHDGETRARVDVHLDDHRTGESVLEAFEELWAQVGGELGSLRELRHLGWDALESVLRAERCALHDPNRGGPHDQLAALQHLGRAVGDAPAARFPAERLAMLALEVALPQGRNLAEAALRALDRASEDAPDQPDLLEAAGALEVRLGRPREAERRMNLALLRTPGRPRAHTVLAESLRAQGKIDAALSVLQTGLGHTPGDPALEIERGVALAQSGDDIGALAAWQRVLAREGNPRAFANLAALAIKREDTATAQTLVDYALAHDVTHPEMLRRAIHLALASEPEGLARGSRVAGLARTLLERAPEETWVRLVLARALAELEDQAGARQQLDEIRARSPASELAAEADRMRLLLENPAVASEIEAVARAAAEGAPRDLERIASRARRIAGAENVWTAWLALAVAERRRGRLGAADDAVRTALELAPGAPAVHAELASVTLASGGRTDAQAGEQRSEKAPSPRDRFLAWWSGIWRRGR